MVKPSFPDDFKEFLRLLNARHVEYLLVGGYAVSFHGYPRATVDLDIWIGIQPGNAGRLVEVLKEFGFQVPGLSPELFLEKDRIVRMGVPPVRIEIMTTVSGVSFEECYAERVRAVLDGVEADVISLRHLRANKLAAGRHKDLDDLEHLP